MERCNGALSGRWKVIPVEGLFHQWASDFMEFETGPGNYTVALIELDDGRIVKGVADTVVFLDKVQETLQPAAKEAGADAAQDVLMSAT